MALSTIQNNSFADTAVHGRRNLIINGAMQVWQRGTIITGKTSGNNFIADRHYLSLGSAGTWTIEQSTDAPVGFKYSLKYTCTSSVTLSGGNYAVKQYNPEGQDMKHLEFGTSNAKTLTISFWVKSSLSGDFGFAFRNNAGNKCIVKSYTISSANTWEYKTININPATDGTWPDDNGQFGFLNFDLGVGPTYSTTSSNSYTTANKFGLTGGVKIAETTNATWQITGIQLEVGEQATPFEHRSFGDELARCKRYFERFERQRPGAGSAGTTSLWAGPARSGASNVQGPMHYVEKRNNPTISVSSAAHLNTIYPISPFNAALSAFGIDGNAGTQSAYINATGSGSPGSDCASFVYIGDAAGYLDIDAEL